MYTKDSDTGAQRPPAGRLPGLLHVLILFLLQNGTSSVKCLEWAPEQWLAGSRGGWGAQCEDRNKEVSKKGIHRPMPARARQLMEDYHGN